MGKGYVCLLAYLFLLAVLHHDDRFIYDVSDQMMQKEPHINVTLFCLEKQHLIEMSWQKHNHANQKSYNLTQNPAISYAHTIGFSECCAY